MEEFKYIVEIVKLNFKITKNNPFSIAKATVFFPDEINAKYIRIEKYSIITGIAVVNANADNFEMNAVVQVEIYYKGNMTNPSIAEKNKITERLEILSQEICSYYMQEKLANLEQEEAKNILPH